MPYLFLKEDYERLNREIEKLVDEFKKIGKETGEMRNGESPSDNFAFEEGQRQQGLLSTRLKELVEVRNNSRIIPSSETADRVSIGKTVTIRDEDTENVRTFKIGSYRNFDQKNVFSYDAPLCRIILGAKVGDHVEGLIGGKTRSYEVLDIE